MFTFILLVCFGICSAEIQLPHGNELRKMVDQGFSFLDKNGDGGLTFAELGSIVDAEDVNHDGNVTLAEYARYWNMPEEDLRPMFNAYDTDMDGVIHLSYMQQYFHLLDLDNNGIATLHEYEKYMTGVPPVCVQCSR